MLFRSILVERLLLHKAYCCQQSRLLFAIAEFDIKLFLLFACLKAKIACPQKNKVSNVQMTAVLRMFIKMLQLSNNKLKSHASCMFQWLLWQPT